MFRKIVRRYFRRHFRAVRISNAEAFASLGSGPIIVFANHSSWWDPMTSVLLASTFHPSCRHFAPMDADALERYGILKSIGVFGVEMNSLRGAAQFLRTGISVLQDRCFLWITPQGRFADPRERPVSFKPGLAALARKVKGGCTVIPLAIEYPFWDERLPEVLLHFGEAIRVDERCETDVESQLRLSLEESMNVLAAKSVRRDPEDFDLLLAGRVGTGGWYQRGQHAFALLRGRTFQPEHTKTSLPEGHG